MWSDTIVRLSLTLYAGNATTLDGGQKKKLYLQLLLQHKEFHGNPYMLERSLISDIATVTEYQIRHIERAASAYNLLSADITDFCEER